MDDTLARWNNSCGGAHATAANTVSCPSATTSLPSRSTTSAPPVTAALPGQVTFASPVSPATTIKDQIYPEFARFLEQADDVERFAKLPEQFGFAIEYTDNMGNLRYYEPDFVAVIAGRTNYLIETKGLEDVNVASKDRAASFCCENATMLTANAWQYLKVQQSEYNSLQPSVFADLLVLASQ